MKPINRLSLTILGIQFKLTGTTSLMRWIEAYSAGDANAVSEIGIENAQIEKVKFFRKYIFVSPAIGFPVVVLNYFSEFDPMNIAAIGMGVFLGLGVISIFTLQFVAALFDELDYERDANQKASLSSRIVWRFADVLLVIAMIAYV